MKTEQFNEVVKDAASKIIERLSYKGSEYRQTTNRLGQFYYAAEVLGCTPEQTAWTYAMKHIVKLSQHVKDDTLTQEIFDESGYDIMAYMVLIEAILIDDAIRARMRYLGDEDGN